MNTLKQIEDTLDEYFGKKAPALPTNIKEIIVKIAPYLMIIGVIFTVPAILALFGLGAVATVLAPMGGIETVQTVPTMWLGIFLLIPVVILEGLAIPGLFSKSAQAWKYMFWAQLVSVVSNLLQFNFFGVLIGGAIGFYLLFQIKSYYK